MDAIVTAGGIPQPEDPLYTYSHGDSKALIDVAGKPMIQWVLDALSDAKHVDNVIIIGLSPKSNLTCKKPMHFISNQGRMLSNIVAGVKKSLELDKKNEYVLVVSSDIPTIKSEMVDWLVEKSQETQDDLYYGVCPRDVMEGRFPGSKRTYTKLKGIELCGADMHVSHVTMATEHLEMWESLIGNRKSPMKQASIIGLSIFFQVLTRSIGLDDLVVKVSERIDIKGRAIRFPYAEPCMDVDKPNQLEMLREDLVKQQRKSAAEAKRQTNPKGKAKSIPSKTEKPAAKSSDGAKKVAALAAARTLVKPKAKPKTK
ncbi:MAG: nucleotidyltransferase family protein [Chloroflexota bacterium]